MSTKTSTSSDTGSDAAAAAGTDQQGAQGATAPGNMIPAAAAGGSAAEAVAAGEGSDETAGGPSAGQGRRLVWLDPRGLAVHPRNVRDDLGDLSGLAASIAAQGVLEALTVIPTPGGDGTDSFQLVAGHRRAAAAILAQMPTVPCVVRTDLALDAAADDGDRAGQAAHVGAMLAENLHRQGLSAVEEARGVQAMLDLGVPLTRVAKCTGLGRRRVAKAAGVARLDDATAAAVAQADLTLDQAAAVAVYADDPDTAAALIEAAGQGPGQFAHALTRAKREREEAQRLAALVAELTAAGRRVLDPADGARHARLSTLLHDGQPLTAEGHTGCPGSAVYITTGWNGPQVVEACTDPAGNGHTNRWTDTPRTGSGEGAEQTEAEREAAKAERREVIENNKAMAAANETRRTFVKTLLARRTAPKGTLRFAVDTLAAQPRAVSRWLSGQTNTAQDTAAAELGLVAPGTWWPGKDKPAPTLTSGEQLADPRLPVALLAHVAAAIEAGWHRQSWRNPTAGDARWLRFLIDCGYTLADIEQQMLTAVEQDTTDPADHESPAAEPGEDRPGDDQ